MSGEVGLVKYDDIADAYDQRYNLGPEGVIETLLSLAAKAKAVSVLEVGCGTGHWLHLMEKQYSAFGLDLSSAMLDKAIKKNVSSFLCRGEAVHLPYLADSFDFVYCVHAVQHFGLPLHFIKESYRIIRPGGVLAVIGMDPHREGNHWYVYDYFPQTLTNDLRRYVSSVELLELMKKAGFQKTKCCEGGRLDYDFAGDDVFLDPVLHKKGTSQFVLLTGKEYDAGIERIKEDIFLAGKKGTNAVFPVHLQLPALIAFKV